MRRAADSTQVDAARANKPSVEACQTRTYARARSRTHASATTGRPLFLRPLLPEPARHRRGATGELECEQRCSDDFRVKAASRDQRVDGGRRVAEDRDHATLVGGEVVLGGRRPGSEGGAG